MAGVTDCQPDMVNGRVQVFWTDGERQHVTNLLLYPGAEIKLHAHSYAHDTDYGPGVYWFSDGEREGTLRGPGQLHVPIGRAHHFRMVELAGVPGKLDCHWPLGADQ
jgi:hypothetical protein